MKWDRVILDDVFAYGHVDLDLASLGPGVFAICGENGSGKTGLLEVVPAVNWQRLPAREDRHPVGYATSRRAGMEYWWTTDDGQQFHARLNLDGPERKADGVLERLDVDLLGVAQRLSDGKVTSLRSALGEYFPSYDLFIASAFAAQGRGNTFSAARPSQRKDLFAEFLGLARLLRMAKTASEAAAVWEAERDRLRTVMDTLAGETDLTGQLSFDERQRALESAGAELATLRERIRRDIGDVEAKLSTMTDGQAARAVLAQRLAAAEDRLAQAQAAQQRAADGIAAVDATLARTVADLVRRRAASKADLDAAAKKILARCAATLKDLDEKIAGNTKIRARATEIRAAAAAWSEAGEALLRERPILDDLRTQQATCQQALRAAERELAALAPIEQSHARAVSDASLLEAVPCGGEGEYAACQLLVNAQHAKAQIEALAAQLAPKAEIADRIGALARDAERVAGAQTEVEARLASAAETQRQHEALAAYLRPLEASDARVVELQDLWSKAEAEAAADRADAEHRHHLHTEDLAAQDRTARAAHAREHAAYEAALADARTQRDTATAAVQVARAELDSADAGHGEAAAMRGEITRLRSRLETVIRDQATCTADIAGLARERDAHTAALTRLAATTTALRATEQQWMEWRDLARWIGKGGLADLEIDAAGPEVSALTNMLLTSCFDTRFSVELVTQVPRADGQGYKDEFTLRVFDNEATADGWRDLADLSGGQRTIVQEALMLAISLHVNSRLPHPIRTLWRDETGASLSTENAIRYVTMLRRARELGRLHAIYFISHNVQAQAMADARILVADGTATIVRTEAA